MLNKNPESNSYNPSPLDILSSDPGDETQFRFRYQHSFTSIIALQKYAGTIPYTELYCEHHEDILCVREDGGYDGIQIKTRQLKDGPFE